MEADYLFPHRYNPTQPNPAKTTAARIALPTMDFGSISKGNMKRKVSAIQRTELADRPAVVRTSYISLIRFPPSLNDKGAFPHSDDLTSLLTSPPPPPSPLMPKQSLLAALGKPGQRPQGQYQAPPSAYQQQSYTPSLASSDESHENSSATFVSSAGSIHHGHPGSQRSLSNSTTASQLGSMYGRERANITPRGIRRVDDVYLLVKERVAQWSYLMQWYNGWVAVRGGGGLTPATSRGSTACMSQGRRWSLRSAQKRSTPVHGKSTRLGCPLLRCLTSTARQTFSAAQTSSWMSGMRGQSRASRHGCWRGLLLVWAGCS